MIRLSDVLLFYHNDKKFIVKNESEVKWSDSFSLTDSEVSDLICSYPADYSLHLLRQQRNQLLAATDWRMASDYPGANQTEWQTYRQALRDITTQTPSLDADGNLTGITWPTPPND